MADAEFPKPVEDIVATLADIYRYQKQHEVVEMLETAAARIDQIEYDNWNGGTYSYALTLDVPVAVFAGLEKRLGAIENDIQSKIAVMCRTHIHHSLNSVAIAPLTSRFVLLSHTKTSNRAKSGKTKSNSP
jgi:hypothetical protein